jgi:hypothetical protein
MKSRKNFARINNGLDRDRAQGLLVRELIPRRTSSVAFDPSRVHNVPSQYKYNVDERDQDSQKKIKEATEKRLANHSPQGK